MKNFLLIILLFSIVNCNRYIPSEQRKQLKDLYISEFKMIYLKKLFRDAYDNSPAIKSILKNDASSFGETLLSLDDYKLIDQAVKADNKILIADSINSYNLKAEGAQGKAVFDYALKKYNSKWLDSLAHKRYKLFRQSGKNFEKQLREN